jgi:flavodoxin
MLTLVIYDSSFGNTARVARAIGRGAKTAGDALVMSVTEAGRIEQAGRQPDLLFVGGPTHRHRMSAGLGGFLEAIPRGSLRGIPAATFDTRYRMSAFLTGSAATAAAGRLRREGCRLVARPESFFMQKDAPPDGEKRRHALEGLEPGELERAEEWGRVVAGAALAAAAR